MLNQIIYSPFALDIKTPVLLLILVVLEAVLSADNAIALASITQTLEDPRVQRRALNLGLVIAYILRMLLIVTATWVVKFWQFQLVGAAYLLWLVFKYFSSPEEEQHHNLGASFSSLWQIIPLIAITDLAFSLDSVTTAIAVSEQTWLILIGGTIGIIALRFLAELFIRWLKEFSHLEDAGYITVGFVGIRLLLKALTPDLAPPEWLMMVAIAGVFIWGFSQKTEASLTPVSEKQYTE